MDPLRRVTALFTVFYVLLIAPVDAIEEEQRDIAFETAASNAISEGATGRFPRAEEIMKPYLDVGRVDAFVVMAQIYFKYWRAGGANPCDVVGWWFGAAQRGHIDSIEHLVAEYLRPRCIQEDHRLAYLWAKHGIALSEKVGDQPFILEIQQKQAAEKLGQSEIDGLESQFPSWDPKMQPPPQLSEPP